MSDHLKIALGGAVAGLLVILAGISILVLTATPTEFNERWRIARPNRTVSSPEFVQPNTIETIRVIPLTEQLKTIDKPVEIVKPVEVKPAVKPVEVIKPKMDKRPTIREKSYRDVCKRHGLRKVYTGKYRWRCKR